MPYATAKQALNAAGQQHAALSAGVPEGAELRPHERILWVRDEGAVVEDLDIAGQVVVKARGVTIRRCRVRAGVKVQGARLLQGAPGLLVEDCELDGRGVAQIGVDGSGVTLRRTQIHSCADGARLASGFTMEGCWVHGLSRIGTLHGDAAQCIGASGIAIRGSILDAVSADGSDLNNAAVMIGSESRPTADLLIEGNVLCGGNYTVNVRGDISATNVVVQGNTFVPVSRYGQYLAPSRVPLGRGNILLGDGKLKTSRAK